MRKAMKHIVRRVVMLPSSGGIVPDNCALLAKDLNREKDIESLRKPRKPYY